MLRCRSCLLDCLRAVLPEAPSTTRFARHPYINSRRYATQVTRSDDQYGFSRIALHNRYRRTGAPAPIKPSLERKLPEHELRNLKKELVYLTDPAKLALTVRGRLMRNQFDHALALVRLASKTVQCTVAWNHVIDYLMAVQATNAAFKAYNEMKKRAVFPDAYTVSLIMRGVANNTASKEETNQAVTLYHSLSAPNSRIQRSIIHTNATLQVCAKSKDMDNLWSVVGTIPDTGREAADATTFTIILNAIRANAVDSAARLGGDARVGILGRAVDDGTRIWQDVIRRWRTGQLRVDESLVCAMGRLLLAGTRPEDWDTVFSLLEQTMNVQRLIPRWGSEERQMQHLAHFNLVQSEDSEVLEQYSQDESSDEPKEVFAVVPSRHMNPGLFAVPRQNTLSLVMEACEKMSEPKLAINYWNFLTGDSGAIKPDLNNYHAMFRILRTSRASARAVELLAQITMPNTPSRSLATDVTFLIVMSICVRDKNNPNIMNNATRVLDYMERVLPTLPARPMVMYLALAEHTNTPSALSRAYSRVAPLVKDLKDKLADTNRDWTKRVDYKADAEQAQAYAVLKGLISCIDVMTTRKVIPEAERELWAQRRKSFISYLTRFANRKIMESRGVRVKRKESKTYTMPRRSRSESGNDESELELLERPRRESRRPSRGKRSIDSRIWVPAGAEGTAKWVAANRQEWRREDRQMRHLKRNRAIKADSSDSAGSDRGEGLIAAEDDSSFADFGGDVEVDSRPAEERTATQ